MRQMLIAVMLLLAPISAARAQIRFDLGLPGINIGVNMPVYPELVQIPGYPVYYDPQVSSNYFFYDGLYWVYQGDDWYESSWYNGPWRRVDRDDVPAFVLRVPVRYYRHPPEYFRGWRGDEAPRWGEHWGHDWEEHHRGWDRWDRHASHAAAPLPVYQRRYSGDSYPRAPERQGAIRADHYRYQPREAIARSHFQQEVHPGERRAEPGAGAPPAHAEAHVPGRGGPHEMGREGRKSEERGRN